MSDEMRLEQYFATHQEEFFTVLKTLVELESPSHDNKAASDRCGRYIQGLLEDLGCQVTAISQTECGDHIYAEFGDGPNGCLVIGHYDTVFPIGSLQEIPFRIEGERAYGPGIFDMKGGIVLAIFAVRALKELQLLPKKKIGFFFNSDEESGSVFSRDAIVEAARRYEYVLVAEPGVEEIGSVKKQRYGRGTYRVTAHGRAAHSGVNPQSARSPLLEMAHQLLAIDGMNDYENGVTFASTCIQSGVYGTCMVPEDGWFMVDVRAKTTAQSQEADRSMFALQSVTPDVSLEITGGIDKPPMEGSPYLLEHAQKLGREMGIEVFGVTVGGGSDGNFTSGVGIPTLDGLGMSGALLHTPHEYIHVEHIPKRGALLARMLQTL